MLLDLLLGWLSGLPGQPPRRALFLWLIELHDLPLALAGVLFIIMKGAEIIRRIVLAPLFGAGRGRRTSCCVILFSLRPYGFWLLMPYIPRR